MNIANKLVFFSLVLVINITIYNKNNIGFCSEISYDMYEESEEEYVKISDPLEKMNRKIFKFDMFLLKNVVHPFLKGYRFVTPKFMRNMINNFGKRMNDIPTFMYSVLMLDYKNSAKTLGVFSINMTVGVFGLFDPASSLNLTRRSTGLGDVFSYYNVDNGFYLVLPFLGPSTLTDGVGTLGNLFIDPLHLNELEIGGHRSWTPKDLVVESYFIEYIDTVEGADNINKKIIKNSFDPYAVVKNMYIENKNHRIKMIKDKK
jgi:phospholipid-binding lipoprotein MlaA